MYLAQSVSQSVYRRLDGKPWNASFCHISCFYFCDVDPAHDCHAVNGSIFPSASSCNNPLTLAGGKEAKMSVASTESINMNNRFRIANELISFD